MSDPADRGVRDRRVLLVLVGVVLVVLGADLLSALVPGVDRLLSKAPILVVVLVAGTIGVLVLSVGRGRRA
jgi:hypothetical protein